MRRAVALGVVLALALAATGRAQTPELGVNVNRVLWDAFDGGFWDLHLGAVRDSGIGLVRSDAFWEAVEPDPPSHGVHDYDWLVLDFHQSAMAQHDLRWQAIVDYSAEWASTVPGEQHAPPASVDDFADYAGALAARYGRGGDFWAAFPDLTELPVTTYEIWNEPNLAGFWQPAPDPDRYMELYAAARAAIEAVDPDATVIVGGLVPGTDFAERLYASRPDARELIDGIGYHPYAQTADGGLLEVRALRRQLDALGAGAVPIHVTELGWHTNGSGAQLMGEDARAAALERAAGMLARSDCGLASIVPYTWTTPERDPADREDWYGIRHPDGGATPTSDAYARVVARPGGEPVPLCHGPDTDGDDVPDLLDSDDDADGAPDAADAFPLDPAERSDADADGTGDNADPDDDNDGLPDAVELARGTSPADADSDDDGVPDPADAFPLDRAERADADLDGAGDNGDPDDDNDALADALELARGSSPLDRDSDDDGLADGIERRTSPTRADSDGDKLKDGLERGLTSGLPDGPGLVRGTKPSRFRPDTDPRTKTLATKKDSDGDKLSDGREDRNRNGRRDRGETDPLKRTTPN
jgi:hypothetical protein